MFHPKERKVKYMKKIYFCGTLFTSGEQMFNRVVRDLLVKEGVEVIFPQENNSKFITDEGIDCKGIYLEDKGGVKECDILLMNCDGGDCDSGSCVELGMGIILNKLIIGYRTDIRFGGDSPDGVNLMVSEGIKENGVFIKEFLMTPEDLVKKIVEIIK